MKKILFSLAALLAFGIASAQTKPTRITPEAKHVNQSTVNSSTNNNSPTTGKNAQQKMDTDGTAGQIRNRPNPTGTTTAPSGTGVNTTGTKTNVNGTGNTTNGVNNNATGTTGTNTSGTTTNTTINRP